MVIPLQRLIRPTQNCSISYPCQTSLLIYIIVIEIVGVVYDYIVFVVCHIFQKISIIKVSNMAANNGKFKVKHIFFFFYILFVFLFIANILLVLLFSAE